MKKVVIEREWDYPLAFKISLSDRTIRFNSLDGAVNYCVKMNWKFEYDDMLDV